METAGYVRVSSRRQRDQSDSPENQETTLRSAGATVIYRDLAVSGFKLEQRRRAEDFRRLLSDIRSGRIRRLLATRIDRYARRDEIFQELVAACEQFGVSFESLAGGVIDTKNPTNWLSVKMQLIMAEFYSRQLSQSIRGGLAAQIARGVSARPAGSLPFHLMREPGTRHGVIPSPKFDAARDVVLRIGSGELSLAQATEILGLRNGSLSAWLRRPCLLGHASNAAGEIVVRDCWPALVTPAEQEAAIAVITGRRNRWGSNAHGWRTPHSLTGICVCSVCGSRMAYKTTDGRAYLRCSAELGKCTVRTRSVRDHLIEQPLVAIHLQPHIEAIVASKAPERPAIPEEVVAWRRELRHREATPPEYLMPHDRARIVELQGLIAQATAVAGGGWIDTAAAARLALILSDVTLGEGGWFSRSPEQRNADLRLVLLSVTVDVLEKSIVEVSFRADPMGHTV